MKYFALLLLLSSCYSQQKARQQHGRAVTTFPEIGADFCARTYPPKDSLIAGDTVTLRDTSYIGVEITDTLTVVSRDTVYKTITRTMPPQVITERVTVRDTIIRVSTAAVDLERIQARKALDVATDATARAEKMEVGRDRWRIIALIAIGLLGLGVIARVKRWV